MNDQDIVKFKMRVRTHGLKYPLHPWQISSWIFYLTDISAYYIIVMTIIKHNMGAHIALTVLFTISFLILWMLDLRSLLINPTDKLIKQIKTQQIDIRFTQFC